MRIWAFKFRLFFKDKKKKKRKRLNCLNNQFEILLLSNFKVFVGMLLGKTTLRDLRVKIIFWISVFLIGFIKNELISLSVREYDRKKFLLELFMKYSLNACAMYSDLADVVLF